MRKLFFLLVLSLLLSPLSALADEAAWTLAWYIAPADEPDPGAGAMPDLSDLTAIPLPESVQVVLETAGPAGSDPAPQRWLYSSRGLEQLAPPAAGNDPLSDFLRFVDGHYPARHRALIIRDHRPLPPDPEAAARDLLDPRHLQAALSRVYRPDPEHPPLDLIGLDAGFSATLGQARHLHGLARILVASATAVSAAGWPCAGIVRALGRDPALDATALGRLICTEAKIHDAAQGQSEGLSHSVIALAATDRLIAVLNALALEALNAVSAAPGRAAIIARALATASREAGLADLKALVGELRPELPLLSAPALKALQETVILEQSGPLTASGGLLVDLRLPPQGPPHALQIVHALLTAGGDRQSLIPALADIASDLGHYALAHPENDPAPIPNRVADDLPAASFSVNEDGDGVQNAIEYVTGSADPTPAVPGSRPAATVSALTAPEDRLSAVLAAFRERLASGPLIPSPAADLRALADLPLSFSDSEEIRLETGPQAAAALAEVTLEVQLFDEEQDVRLSLGEAACLSADWAEGSFTASFNGSWPALDDHYVHLDLIWHGGDRQGYAVPIRRNGRRGLLELIHDGPTGRFHITGVRSAGAEGRGRELRPLQAGETITLLMPAASLSAPEEPTEIDYDTFTLAPGFAVRESEAADQDLLLRCRLRDLRGETVGSEWGRFTSADGEITLAPFTAPR